MHDNNSKETGASKNHNSISIRALPNQIVFEILARLPVKSLIRFRSVSKEWQAIVAPSYFVDLNLIRSKTRSGGGRILISFSNFDGSKHYFYSSSLRGGKSVPLLSLPRCKKGNIYRPCKCHVSESLNGLICFYNVMDVYICNPSTKSTITLPTSKESTEWYSKLYDSFINIP